MKNRNILIIFIFLLSLQSKGQENINKVHYDFTKENLSVDTKSDTINNYILFEEGFENDSVTIYIGGSIFQSEVIKTNRVVGLAKKVKIPDCIKEKYFLLKINNSQKVPIFIDSKNKYIRINWGGDYELLIKYSKYYPVYY